MFGKLPLQFTYLDSSHYNSSSTGNKPLDTYLKALGPCAAYASLNLQKCHSLPLSLTPWTHLIASSSPIPSPPPHSPAPAAIGLPRTPGPALSNPSSPSGSRYWPRAIRPSRHNPRRFLHRSAVMVTRVGAQRRKQNEAMRTGGGEPAVHSRGQPAPAGARN